MCYGHTKINKKLFIILYHVNGHTKIKTNYLFSKHLQYSFMSFLVILHSQTLFTYSLPNILKLLMVLTAFLNSVYETLS